MIKGIAASPGIEIGKAHVIENEQICIDTGSISLDDIAEEVNQLQEAIDISKLQLEQIKGKAEKELGTDKAAIFELI